MTDSRKKTRRYLRWAIELIVVVALVAGIQFWRTRDAVSGPAPMLEAVTIDGSHFSLSGGNLPVLVHFWASWCAICRLEQGTIDALARDHSVITVALSSGTDDEIGSYLTEHGLRFPVINDPDGVLSATWGVTGVPTSFVVDTDGKIRFVTSGYTTGPGLRARMWLAQAR